LRIERIDVHSSDGLSGSFAFPLSGLGVWAAPNQGGKSGLTRAIALALYGDVGRAGADEPRRPSRVVLRLVRDDGERLAVGRDLSTGAVRVVGADQQDVTTRYHNAADGVEVGEALLGLTRSQFLEIAFVRFDDLGETPGNRALLALLRHGRGRRRPADGSTPRPTPLPASPAAPADDLQIVRSAAEELGYLRSGGPAEGSDASRSGYADPDAPGLPTVERLRRMRSALRFLDEGLETKRGELRAHSLSMQEAQTEAQRLSTLTGAEPGDVEKLGSLIDQMKKVQDQREELGREEAKFRREIEEAQVPIDEIAELDGVFRTLDEDDQAFLTSYREAEKVRRGTQALLRSEGRLDETRIQEIGIRRGASARLAILPLGASIAGVGASIFSSVTGWAVAPPALFLGLGIAGATLSALLVWRARGLREQDREQILAGLEGRHAHLSELDREMQEAAARLATIAARFDDEPPAGVLDQWERWKEFRDEVQRLHSLRRRARALDKESSQIRSKLDSFSLTREDPPTVQTGPTDLDKLYREYSRFFELRQQLDAETARGIRLEDDLATLETERADLRERLERALARAGIDASRSLDEAVERFALKGVEVEIDPPAKSSRQTDADGDETAPAGGGDTSWIAAISARTEAIVRRFLPDVRRVEVDEELAPTLQLDPRGPRLGVRDLERELSSGARDQLCLALRLAIVETVSASGERFPVFLDDPLIRADDTRHDVAVEFLIEDAATRNQVVLLTSQGMRLRWFLHQVPHQREHVASIAVPAASAVPVSSQGSSRPA